MLTVELLWDFSSDLSTFRNSPKAYYCYYYYYYYYCYIIIIIIITIIIIIIITIIIIIIMLGTSPPGDTDPIFIR